MGALRFIEGGNRMFRTAVFAILAVLASAPVLGETAYVDDTLRVGVRRNANSTETPLTVITSGARLEVLERNARYWRVRTEDGVEGWVGASYVTSTPPARVQLEALRAENARLKAALETRTADPQLVGELEALQLQYQQLQARLAVENRPTTLGWITAALLIMLLVGGFFLGKRHERDRVVRRFNGLEL